MVGFGRVEKPALINSFASGQVKYYGAKLGIQVKDSRYPISHITIDGDGVLHGWNVQVQNNSQRYITYGQSLTEFARTMRGVMKVHSALIKTMRDPEVYDHN